MKLTRLTLKNFKGIKDFDLVLNGNNVSIYADNAVGKTTLFDSLCWLLFGKDSQNKKDFDFKTLENGQAIPGIDHDVIATFDIGGRPLTLKKSYKEVYKKKKGTPTAIFSGHTTDHFIDGVPVPEKDYAAKIAEIANEDIFKLLTNPTYFNTQLKWEKRREILMNVCGDVSDADVIASDSRLVELKTIIPDGRTLDAHRKVITARRTEINKELEKIPVRIDEVTQSLSDLSGIGPEADLFNAKIKDLKNRVREKNQEIDRIQAGGQVAEKMKTIREVEGKLLDIKNRHRENVGNKIAERRNELALAQHEIRKIQLDISDKQAAVKRNENLIIESGTKADQLRKEWHGVNGLAFDLKQEAICPACGQDLPESQLPEAKEKAQAAFNLNKAEDLARINKEGKTHKARAEELKAANADLEAKITLDQERLAAYEKEVVRLETVISDMSAISDISEDPAYRQAMNEKEFLEAQIQSLKTGNAGQVAIVNAEISMLETEISGLETKLAQVDQVKKGKTRIAELSAEEKKLAKEFEQLEKELHLTDLFTKAKVSLLDEKINSKFKLARFKMFNELINGGVEPTCETLYGGVPFGSGLNSGHKIIVGMDIIATLSEHYGFWPVIFVDNAESVSVLPKMKAQVIRLVKPDMEPPKSEDMSPEKYQQLCDQLKQKYSKLVVKIEAEEKELREAV